jgi:exodeoxyribonuclease-3
MAARFNGLVLTIATVNVNGIRAAMRRGMGDWLLDAVPDVLALQEVRAPTEILVELLGGWQVVHDAGPIAGRAGVAICVRPECLSEDQKVLGSQPGLPTEIGAGRWLETTLATSSGPLTVISVYAPTGHAPDPVRQEAKYAFFDAATTRLAELMASGQVLALGDLNIAHREEDLKNWRGNRNNAGFLPAERAYLDNWFGRMGLVDVGRRLAGPGPGPYTWWSWRGRAYDNDAGWRIDYHVATPDFAALACAARIDRAPTWAERWSDHAPVVVDYNTSIPVGSTDSDNGQPSDWGHP